MDALHERVVAEGLLHEVEGALLERGDRHRDVPVSGEEDHRPRGAERLVAQLREEALAAQSRHADVEEDATRVVARGRRRVEVLEERLRGFERAAGKAVRLEQPRERVAQRLLVVDDVDHGATGSHRWNATPSSMRSNQSRPPCACTMVWQIERPMPIPSGLVVKKGAKTFSESSAAMPAPKSRTLTRSPAPSRETVTTRRRRSGGASAIASIALRVRLRITCCSITGSPRTAASPGSAIASTLTRARRACRSTSGRHPPSSAASSTLSRRAPRLRPNSCTCLITPTARY